MMEETETLCTNQKHTLHFNTHYSGGHDVSGECYGRAHGITMGIKEEVIA